MKPPTMKTKLYKQLSGYTAFAAAFLSGSNKDSYAQIVYTDPTDIILDQNGSLPLDLDNDGSVDFQFLAYNDSGTEAASILITGNPANSIMYGPCVCTGPSYCYPARVLGDGMVIKKNHNYFWYGNSFGCFICANNYTSCNDLWGGKHHKFIGVRFVGNPGNNNAKHYGWIRVSVALDCKSITVHDWAYNTQINKSIAAGQTLKTAQENPLQDELSVFAVDHKLYIQNNYQRKALAIEVYNSVGQLLVRENESDNDMVIPLNNVTTGICIVKVQSEASTESYEVFVSH